VASKPNPRLLVVKPLHAAANQNAAITTTMNPNPTQNCRPKPSLTPFLPSLAVLDVYHFSYTFCSSVFFYLLVAEKRKVALVFLQILKF